MAKHIRLQTNYEHTRPEVVCLYHVEVINKESWYTRPSCIYIKTQLFRRKSLRYFKNVLVTLSIRINHEYIRALVRS